MWIQLELMLGSTMLGLALIDYHVLSYCVLLTFNTKFGPPFK